MASEYEYTPIQEPDGIRLIELQPAAHVSAPIHCRLVHQRLSLCDSRDIYCHTPYTALSYAWGCTAKTKTITVNGDKTLWITANLFLALSDLRHEIMSVFLWADGISINQSDNGEKSAQVSMMGCIYAGANHTIIHLPAAATDAANHCNVSGLLDFIIGGKEQSLSRQVNRAWDFVLGKEWFTRVWVFQELVLSRTPWIQIGCKKVTWARFCNALTESYGLSRKIEVILDMNDTRSKSSITSGLFETPTQPGCDMLKLLTNRRAMGVSDPRDMVFAHVGLAIDGRDEGLMVDYSKSCEAVYEDCARWLARKHGSQALFDCAYYDQASFSTHQLRLPSWVPDWTLPVFEGNDGSYTRTSAILTPVIPMRQAVFSCVLKSWGTVIAMSSVLSKSMIPIDTQEKLQSSTYSVLNPTMQSKDEKRGNALWEADILPVWINIIQDPELIDSNLKLDLSYCHYTGSYETTVKCHTSVQTLLMEAFHRSATSLYIEGKRLVRLSNGELAILPAWIEQGDIISSIGTSKRGKSLYLSVNQP